LAMRAESLRQAPPVAAKCHAMLGSVLKASSGPHREQIDVADVADKPAFASKSASDPGVCMCPRQVF
jgi:hypothetical protein